MQLFRFERFLALHLKATKIKAYKWWSERRFSNVAHVLILLAYLFGVGSGFYVALPKSSRAAGEISISSWTDLNNVRNNSSASYILTRDLTPTDADYAGIGDSFIPIPSFTGTTFDGGSHQIQGLKINTSDPGLFFQVTGTTISNLGVTDAEIGGDLGTCDYGVIVAQASNVTIYRSYATGVIHGTSSNCGSGGLVGYAGSTTISDSYTNVTIEDSYYAGGLIAYSNNSAIINNSYAIGNVNGVYAGGLSGSGIYEINNSFATGLVTGGASGIGGILGDVAITITNSDWYYQTGSPTSCYPGGDTGCTQQTDLNYFKGNSTNEPMASWDFNNVWTVVPGDYPILSWQIAADTIAPVISNVVAPATTTGESSTITADITDADSGLKTVQIKIGSGDYVTFPLLSGNTNQYSLTAPNNSIAPITYQIKAEDNNGNISTKSGTITVTDNDLPVLGEITGTTGTTAETTTVTVAATDNVSVDVYISINNGTYQKMTATEGNYTYGVAVPNDSVADIKYKIKIIDAGNNSMISDEKTITVTDNDPPTITGITNPKDLAAQNGVIAVTVTDNIAVISAQISFDGVIWENMTNADTAFTYEIKDLDLLFNYHYSIRVFDAAGNKAEGESAKVEQVVAGDEDKEKTEQKTDKWAAKTTKKVKDTAVIVAGVAAEIIKQTPPPVAHTFPYFLFALLAIFAWRLAVSVKAETVQAAKILEIVRLEKIIAEDKENFILLSSHYLRTPLTILRGGFDLTKAAEAIKSKLGAAIESLDAEIQRILKLIEHNKYLMHIVKPDIKKVKVKVYTSLLIWLPIVLIAGLALLANYLFINLQVIKPATVNLIVQAIVFAIVAQFAYSVIRRHFTEKENLENLEKTMKYESEMDKARNLFIEQTTESLTKDLDRISSASKNINDAGTEALTEGQTRLKTILTNLLLLKDIKSGTKVQDRTVLTPHLILNKILKSKADLIKSKNIQVEKSGLLGTIHQNEELVNFVLSTVIDNAVKFSKENGKVGISYTGQKGLAKFTVTDSGPGISKEGMMHLFKPFTRTTSAMNFNYEGFGFSLFLSKIISEHMGGDIQIQSQEGKGTVVTVIFEM